MWSSGDWSSERGFDLQLDNPQSSWLDTEQPLEGVCTTQRLSVEPNYENESTHKYHNNIREIKMNGLLMNATFFK